MTATLPASRPRDALCLRRRSVVALPAVLLAACSQVQAPAPPPVPDAVPDLGLYQIPPGATPDGTFRATIARGATVARGTLMTNTLRIPITLQGLGAATTPAEVNGQVFGLGRTDEILGTFRPVGVNSAGAQVDLSGGLQLGNDKLVVMRLWPAREGQALTVAPSGVVVTLRR